MNLSVIRPLRAAFDLPRGLLVRAFLLSSLVSGVVAAFVLIPAREWRSQAVLLAEASSAGAAGALSALAGSLGVSIGGAANADNPAVYKLIAESPELLESLDTVQFSSSRGAKLRLRTVLKVDEPDSVRALGFLAKRMRDDVLSVRVDRGTSTLALDVVLPDSIMATAVLREITDALARQNAIRRQYQAKRESEFLESIAAVQADKVDIARAKLVRFRSENRRIEGSPALGLQDQFLNQALSKEVEILAFLDKQLADSRIRAVRDLPTFSVIVGPTYPRLPERRRAILKIGLSFLVSFALVLSGGILLREGRKHDDGDVEAV